MKEGSRRSYKVPETSSPANRVSSNTIREIQLASRRNSSYHHQFPPPPPPPSTHPHSREGSYMPLGYYLPLNDNYQGLIVFLTDFFALEGTDLYGSVTQDLEINTELQNVCVIWQFDSQFTKNCPYCFPQGIAETAFPSALDESFFSTTFPSTKIVPGI